MCDHNVKAPLVSIESLYTKTATVLYRGSKPCEKRSGRKIIKRVIFKTREHRSDPDRFGYRKVYSIDFLAPWGEEFLRYLPHQVPGITCQCCGRYMVGKRISGTVNVGVPCDRRCTGATGHNCECSCGGINHGADHAFNG